MLRFIIRTPDAPERTLEVPEDAFDAGANPALKIPLGDPAAAPRQFRIEVRDIGIVLRDLSPDGSTTVNGDLASQVRLQVGDVIRVGATELVLSTVGPAPAPAAARTMPPATSAGAAPRIAVARAAPARVSRAPGRLSRSTGPILSVVFLVIIAGAVILFLNQGEDQPVRTAWTPSAGTGLPVESGTTEPDSGSVEAPVYDPTVVEAELLPVPEAAVPVKVEPVRPPEPDPVAAAAAREARERTEREEAARREREQKLIEVRGQLAAFREGLAGRLAGYSFDGPISDLAGLVKAMPPGALAGEAGGLLNDLTRARGAYLRLPEIFQDGGRKIRLASGLELLVTGADEDGFDAKIQRAEMRKRWSELQVETVHDTVAEFARTAPDWMDLAALAFVFGNVAESEGDLARAWRADEEVLKAVGDVLARRRDVDLPVGGFVLVKGEWLTIQEKGFVEQGLVRHDGRWMTQDEAMAAQGFVKHEGRWLSPKEYEDVLEAQREAEALAAKYMPKGLIDKPGNGAAMSAWADAPEIRTPHYRVTTNLSREIGQDLAYTMEILRTNLKSVFGLTGKGQRFGIKLVASQEEYREAWPRAGRSLGFCSQNEICTFYQPPMTTAVLMHEGTHQMVRWLCSTCPRWMHEGLATYFECSQFRFDAKSRKVKLDVGLLNGVRLQNFQRELESGRAVSLETFLRGQGGNPYTQGWAFVYYLAKGADGRYGRQLHGFIDEAHKTDVVERFQKTFRVRDLSVFEEEWHTFIRGLDPAKGVDMRTGHR